MCTTHQFKAALLLILSTAFYSCGAPSFTIVQVNDKFSDMSQPFGFLGKNNRLSSKSTLGGIHMDSKGVYLDPYVYKDRTSNAVISIGFHVAHYNFDIESGFRPILEIIFLTDTQDRIALKIEAQDRDYSIGSWNTISRDYNTSFQETGICSISLDDYRKLAFAKTLEAKIVGGKLTQTYEKGNVPYTFIMNLKAFYDKQIK